MQFRKRIKKLVRGSVPWLRGRFRYFDHMVYFPPRSHIFERTCDEGTYEPEVTSLVVALAQAGSTYIDVGANIGLLSVPVLAARPGVKVVSIEASPVTLPYLLKTRAGATRRDDWTVIGTAVGAEPGELQFWSGGGAQGAFDGLRDTGRGGSKQAIPVAVRTIDDIWNDLGKPPVSVIKMDIEGGELHALQGALHCIDTTRPTLVIEWSSKNLPAYGIAPDALFALCDRLRCQAYAVPGLTRIASAGVLRIAMALTDTFILVPDDD